MGASPRGVGTKAAGVEEDAGDDVGVEEAGRRGGPARSSSRGVAMRRRRGGAGDGEQRRGAQIQNEEDEEAIRRGGSGEEEVYCAVGKAHWNWKANLRWVLANFPGRRLVLAHVHRPPHRINMSKHTTTFLTLM